MNSLPSLLLASIVALLAACASNPRSPQVYDPNEFMGDATVLPDDFPAYRPIGWQALLAESETQIKLGDLSQAKNTLLKAQAAAEVAIGSLATSPEPVLNSRMSMIGLYLNALSIRQGDAAALFEQAERARARAFVNLMATTELAFNDDKASNRKIRSLDAEVLKLRTRQANGENGLQDKVDDLILRREGLLAKLGASNPEWATAYSLRYATLPQLQSRLMDGDLLVYAVPETLGGSVQLRWLLITNKTATIASTPLDTEGLRRASSLMNTGVMGRDTRLQAESVELYRKSLAMNGWPQAERLFVVPSNEVYQVPWGLMVSDGLPVSVLPHARWAMRQGLAMGAPVKGVALGDPDFAGQLSQLPGARREVTMVAGRYGLAELTGFNASYENLLELARKRVDLMHLATHGVFRPESPLETTLYFSGTDKGPEEITANDIYQNPVRARLVVLSACESGLGKSAPDQDLQSLQRAFFMNGSDTVVSTLWPVNDLAATDFVRYFYSNLSMGASKAWSKAVQQLAAKGYMPADYGAFVVSGDMDTGRVN